MYSNFEGVYLEIHDMTETGDNFSAFGIVNNLALDQYMEAVHEVFNANLDFYQENFPRFLNECF